MVLVAEAAKLRKNELLDMTKWSPMRQYSAGVLERMAFCCSVISSQIPREKHRRERYVLVPHAPGRRIVGRPFLGELSRRLLGEITLVAVILRVVAVWPPTHGRHDTRQPGRQPKRATARISLVRFPFVAKFLSEKQAFTHLQNVDLDVR